MVLFPVILLFSPSCAVVYIGNTDILRYQQQLISKLPLERIIHRGRYMRMAKKRVRRVKAHVYLLLAAVACSVRNFRGVNFRSFFTLSRNTGTVYDVFIRGGVVPSTRNRKITFTSEKFSPLSPKNNTPTYIILPHEQFLKGTI